MIVTLAVPLLPDALAVTVKLPVTWPAVKALETPFEGVMLFCEPVTDQLKETPVIGLLF